MSTLLERIIELERLNAEQQKELAALKAELSKPEANYDGPEIGYYWDRLIGRVVTASVSMKNNDGILYNTPEEAEWQGNSERVRRKLQRIAKALNPPGWTPTVAYGRYEFWEGGGVNTGSTGIYFVSNSLREQAREILGDDIKYLNWYNSPEFKK